MLCTFTLATNTQRILVIRSDDIRELTDIDGRFVPPGQDINAPLDQIASQAQSDLAYLIGTEPRYVRVLGTAKENMDRLQREEIEAVMRVNAFQQQMQAQPQIPANLRPRGKVRT